MAKVVEEIVETEEEQQPPEIDSKYRLIILAAERSKQLQRGALPKIEINPQKHKATRIALQEILHQKVMFKIEDEESGS